MLSGPPKAVLLVIFVLGDRALLHFPFQGQSREACNCRKLKHHIALITGIPTLALASFQFEVRVSPCAST